jgi:hypothetical protein
MTARAEGAFAGTTGGAALPAKHANATVRFVGGQQLGIVQGPNVANSRIEAAHETTGKYASLTETSGRVAFVNPVTVAYVQQYETASESGPAPREARARVHFLDGTALDVVQGIAIANKRLEEARASAGLFAYLTLPSGTAVYVNRLAVTHLTADP